MAVARPLGAVFFSVPAVIVLFSAVMPNVGFLMLSIPGTPFRERLLLPAGAVFAFFAPVWRALGPLMTAPVPIALPFTARASCALETCQTAVADSSRPGCQMKCRTWRRKAKALRTAIC